MNTRLAMRILLISVLMVFIPMKSSHQRSSSYGKKWRNFPVDRDCAMYHRECKLNSDCGKCYNKPMKCRVSNSVATVGLPFRICKTKYDDDPYKKRGDNQLANRMKA